jgi:hypothetical protein
MTETATEAAEAPASTVRPFIVDILAEHEDWAYLLHPELPVRPATAGELAKVEEQARAEYAAAQAASAAVGTAPRGPWPVAKAAVTAPEPAAEPEPQPEPEAAEDPAPELDPIRELALERFTAEHDAQDQREATAQIAAVGDSTEVITEGEAK